MWLHQVEVVHDGEGEEEAVESSLVLHLHFKENTFIWDRGSKNILFMEVFYTLVKDWQTRRTAQDHMYMF